jgi:hypothetical protein
MHNVKLWSTVLLTDESFSLGLTHGAERANSINSFFSEQEMEHCAPLDI